MEREGSREGEAEEQGEERGGWVRMNAMGELERGIFVFGSADHAGKGGCKRAAELANPIDCCRRRAKPRCLQLRARQVSGERVKRPLVKTCARGSSALPVGGKVLVRRAAAWSIEEIEGFSHQIIALFVFSVILLQQRF